MTLAIVTPAEARALRERAHQVERPPLVAPVHGNGKLYRGGVPGHRGGSGRPADRVRRALVGLAGAGIAKVLKPLIEGRPVRVLDRDGTVVEIDPSPADRLRAVEIALKYGLGATHKANVGTEASLRIEWGQPEKPVLLLPKLGTEWTEADQATLDKLHAVGPSGSFSPVQGPVQASPANKIVVVDL